MKLGGMKMRNYELTPFSFCLADMDDLNEKIEKRRGSELKIIKLPILASSKGYKFNRFFLFEWHL